MQFRLRTLFLVFFVVAAGFAAFGPSGIVVTPYLIALAMSIRVAIQYKNVAAASLTGLLIVLAFCVGLSSVVSSTYRWYSCCGNVKQIDYALASYESVYGCFPPAYLADAQGRPMHSWRMLILPFVEQQPIYDQYRFDEPWDGPNNQKLAAATAANYWFCR